MELVVLALSIVIVMQHLTINRLVHALAPRPTLPKPVESKPVEKQPAFFQGVHGVASGKGAQ